MSTHNDIRNEGALSVCLPADARDALASAAKAAKEITNELSREAFMEAAIARVKQKYPAFFKSRP